MNPESPKKPPVEAEEEVAHLDDRVVGKAFIWSAVAFIVLVVAIVGGLIYAKGKKPEIKKQVTQLTAPAAAIAKGVEIPTVKFTDVTLAAGITFRHNNSASSQKLLPETMGAGVAFLDFDNDGDQDCLFLNGDYWPWSNDKGQKPWTTPMLYRNDGQGHFTDVTSGSGLDVPVFGMGVAIGDFDNDGLTDVFLACVGENHLCRNVGGGKFSDVTTAAGVAGESKQWSTAACFFDYDNDGKLDLFVGNYVKWSREIDAEVGYKIDGTTRAYGQPMNFEGSFSRLYHNDGGKFSDVSAAAGVQVKNVMGVPSAKTLGVVPADLDNDGYMDLVVANDTTPNFVFHNQKNGTFKECGGACGVAFDSFGNTRGAMGIDAAHYRNDTAFGIAIGNFANEMTALYVSQPNSLSFVDEAIAEGIGPASRLLLKFGVFFFDYDLDGRLDVLSANGHLDEEIVKLQKSQSYRQPAQLFWNTGAKSGASFVAVDEKHAGKDLFQPLVGRGSAYADIDGDGDLDALLTQAGGAPLLLRNDQQLGHHWLRVKLVGTKSNRSAIGAKLVATVNGQTLLREVNPARSYLSASELPVTFGLGKTTKIDSLEITWPSGQKQAVTPEKVDTLLTIEEPR